VPNFSSPFAAAKIVDCTPVILNSVWFAQNKIKQLFYCWFDFSVWSQPTS